jgi:hypothetical protein
MGFPPSSSAAWPRIFVRISKVVALSLATALLLLVFPSQLDSGVQALWPGSHFSKQDRDDAVERGLQFIYKVASNPKYFSEHGSDLLFCFYTISSTAKNQKLREMARTMGQERAREWRREYSKMAVNDAGDVLFLVDGARNADLLMGDVDPRLKARLLNAARHFPAADFFGFDPQREPPPADIPELCPKCKHQNPRGATACEKCRTPLTFRSRYDVWLDALIRTYQGDVYGVELGASYPDALRWISTMRPYPAASDDEDLFNDVSYTVTHIIYTLNDYHKYHLSPAWLPQEFSYLKNNIAHAQNFENGELLGEFLDALRAFGEDESSPEIRPAMEYLLSTQNPDGSWGDVNDPDIYNRYHSTWTAIDGLRQYSFQGQQLRSPELRSLLENNFVRAVPTQAAEPLR